MNTMQDSQKKIWKDTFEDVLKDSHLAEPLKEASQKGTLGRWTKLMTRAVVQTCDKIGWSASAIGHKLELLPIAQSEYLALDVTAFGDGSKRWRYPQAVFELENNLADDRIGYALWKVLCVRAGLRVVICYRRTADAAAELIQFLNEDVVAAMDLSGRMSLEGETIVVVGNRGGADYFPYGFFKWWILDRNTGKFCLMR